MAANRGFLVTGHGTFPLSLVLPLSFTLAVFGDVYEVCLAPSQISNRVRKGRIAQDVASFTHQDTVYVRDKVAFPRNISRGHPQSGLTVKQFESIQLPSSLVISIANAASENIVVNI
ncbi:hypothetical protein E4U11_002870 [Claviceps purpurea]|nr:hypothetical protein E4U11_002870 [Claviceps purpurea]